MGHACIIRSLDSSGSRREIRPNQAVSIAAARGTLVRAESGTLWLTQEGNHQDYILVPGAQYVSRENSKIVVSAIGAAGAVAVLRAEPGAGQGFRGSALRIDPAFVARLRQEARGAAARTAGEWITGLFASVRRALRPLTARYGGPVLRHK
jgi:hypothetical protein